MHVFHIEACIIERISHLTVAIYALFTNDGSFNARRLVAEARDSKVGSLSGEVLGQDIADRLLLVVKETELSASFATLLSVEEVGRFHPHVAQVVDEEHIFVAVVVDGEAALSRGRAKFDE